MRMGKLSIVIPVCFFSALMIYVVMFGISKSISIDNKRIANSVSEKKDSEPVLGDIRIRHYGKE